MAHIHGNRRPLLARIRRIRGQVEAIEAAISEDRDCGDVLQVIAACRGALSALMAQVVDGHVRHHVLDPLRRPTRAQRHAADELLAVVKSYLR